MGTDGAVLVFKGPKPVASATQTQSGDESPHSRHFTTANLPDGFWFVITADSDRPVGFAFGVFRVFRGSLHLANLAV